MDYFDRDASFTGVTPLQKETYIVIQNILCDERSGWKNNTYRDTDIITSYTAPIVKLKNKIKELETRAKNQEILIDSLQKKEKELDDARLNLVNRLDQIDEAKELLEKYSVNSYLEEFRLKKLHTISYDYKMNHNKQLLVKSVETLMGFLLSNILT
jgi:hypothetical protein